MTNEIRISYEQLVNFEGKPMYFLKANDIPFARIFPGSADNVKRTDKGRIVFYKDQEEVFEIDEKIPQSLWSHFKVTK